MDTAYRSAPLADLDPLDRNAVESPDRRVVEVTVEWNNTPLQIAHLGVGDDFALGAVRAHSPHRLAADLGDPTRVWTPVRVTSEGARFAYFNDGSCVSLEPAGLFTETVCGLTVSARWVTAGRPVARALPVERTPLTVWLASLIAVASVVAALSRIDTSWPLSVTPAGALGGGRMNLPADPVLSTPQPLFDGETRGGTGERQRGSEGAMGSRDAPHRYARWAVARSPARGSDAAGASLAGRGIFRALGPRGPVSNEAASRAFASMAGAHGDDRSDVRGAMWGSEVREAFGAEGFGRVGTGLGGGGNGEGTIGMGALGTLGHGEGTGHGQGTGSGSGSGVGYGAGAGRGLRNRGSGPPQVMAAPPQIAGLMSPELIRRVVLRNLGQVRSCQEQGMAVNPGLSGVVTVRFVIGSNGAVMNTQVVDSSVTVSLVGECIAQAVRRWQFPSPDGGVVTVNYPFRLEPSP